MANTESVSRDDLVVCACGGQEFTARDTMEAALYRGELDSLWRDFLVRVAAEKKADEENTELDEEAIDSAAEQFRYQHDLITAEETEQWLATRGLNLDDFSDYFSRRYCGEALGEKAEPEALDYLDAPDPLRQNFAADLIMSGDIEHMTTQLSWRLAAAAAEKDGITPDLAAAERAAALKRLELSEEKLGPWLQKSGHDAAWFDRMVQMEAAYQARSEGLVTPQARQRELSQLRMPLTRFETEVIELESKDAAQEALFCVQQDGMSMEEVAKEGRYPFRAVSFLQEDIAEELQQKFVSVAAGDILEPLPHGEGFELYRIVNKIEPQADDPAVQERIAALLLHRHFTELSARYVEPRLRAVVAHE